MPKKKKEKLFPLKPFTTPVSFDVSLTHKDKEVFKKVIDWLMEMGVNDFEWEYKWEGSSTEFTLIIHSHWADNLATIASLLGDFNGKLEFEED